MQKKWVWPPILLPYIIFLDSALHALDKMQDSAACTYTRIHSLRATYYFNFVSLPVQPVLIKSSAMNSKETLLKASTLMDMSSISTGSAGFKGFYSGRPRSQNQRAAAATPLSPLMMSQQLPGYRQYHSYMYSHKN